MSQRVAIQKKRSSPVPSITVEDDSWLDSWDYKTHRCKHCRRPFRTAVRLQQHIDEWHSRELKEAEKVALQYESGTAITNDDPLPDVDLNLEPDGDLILQFTALKARVSSSVLCTASPVFKKMLTTPGYKEEVALRKARIQETAVVLELEDDSTAMRLILPILHHNSSSTPPSFLSSTFLFELRKSLINMSSSLLFNFICQSGVRNTLQASS